MAELRNTFILKLVSILEKETGFYGGDFSFKTQEQDESGLKFLFKNKFNENIYFQFNLDTELQSFKVGEERYMGLQKTIKSYSFNVNMSPGEFFTEDDVVCNGGRISI
ncbi:hypothetical protein [Clostridium estertheticum]|uniref:hypothetical protein n=1 Tax=Clostridium estertheticum TaxID=238834 RepID=UPI001C7D39A2|nr:hypothetical protein [Clostridium estertheticum]MBX4271453.1 hypothetical protein [Clostridium estertheticum]WLC81006.1 hypothetical protein KTC98_07220 [Clostridium estertheticum]